MESGSNTKMSFAFFFYLWHVANIFLPFASEAFLMAVKKSKLAKSALAQDKKTWLRNTD